MPPRLLIGLDPHPALGLLDRQRGRALQQLRHHADVGRVEMLDDDTGDAAVRRNLREKSLECFEPTRRSTDADDRKRRAGLGRAVFGLR